MSRARRRQTAPGIERVVYQRRDGESVSYRVRWTDAAGRRRSATFDDLGDAEDYRATIRLRRRGGDLDELDRGRTTLREFVQTTWWPQRAGDLALSTQTIYRRMLNQELLPRLGDQPLREIRPRNISALKADMERDLVKRLGPGRGGPTVRKAMGVLQGVLADAVRWQELEHNPVTPIKKPPVTSGLRAVHPPTVEQVETIRILAGDAWSRALMSLLAYAGLRPQEALALEWRHVRERTILIEQRLSSGYVIAGQKSKGRPPRTIVMWDALREDLDAWFITLGRPAKRSLVLPRQGGKHITEQGYRNWRNRRFRDPRDRAGLAAEKFRPYDLRHLRASLRIAEQKLSLQEIAQEMGHTVQQLSETYAHVIADLGGQGAIDVDKTIREGRAAAAPLAAEILAREELEREKKKAERREKRRAKRATQAPAFGTSLNTTEPSEG